MLTSPNRSPGAERGLTDAASAVVIALRPVIDRCLKRRKG